MFAIACCLGVWLGLGLGLGLDSVSGWLVVMHTYLFDFRSSLPRSVLKLSSDARKCNFKFVVSF